MDIMLGERNLDMFFPENPVNVTSDVRFGRHAIIKECPHP